MNKQQSLSLAIVFAISSMLVACGGSGSSSSATTMTNIPPQATPVVSQQPNHVSTPQHNAPPNTPSRMPSLPQDNTSSNTSLQTPSNRSNPVLTEPTTRPIQANRHTANYIQLSEPRLLRKQTPADSHKVAPLSGADKLEIQKALAYTNQLRQQAGVPPLTYDEDLAAYALVRAEESALLFEHKRPNGDDIGSGLTLTNGGYGENLAAGKPTAKNAVLEQWRTSPGHYHNIVDKRFQRVGMGLARIANGKKDYQYYWTQIFGFGNAKSKYHFASGTVDTNISADLADKIILGDGNTITLKSGAAAHTSATQGYQNGQYFTLNHPIYKAAVRYPAKGYQMIVYNPQGSGLSYQTFAEITDNQGIPVQYANIGVPTVPNDNTRLQATYRGVSIGNFRQRDHVYADVRADIDYGLQQKTMNIAFTNARVAPKDAAASQPLTKYSNINFDFAQTLNWHAGEQRFVQDNAANSEHIHAQFYGPNGDEIGGQFVRQLDSGTYEGAFAAKKQ